MLGIVLLAAPGKAAPAGQADADPAPPPNNIDRILYFDSAVRDADDCAVTVDGEQVSFGEGVTNPAMTCPDAFAWTLLVKAISQEFWRNWATDNQTWPAEPYPLCGSAEDKGAGCCQPGATNNPGYAEPTISTTRPVWVLLSLVRPMPKRTARLTVYATAPTASCTSTSRWRR